MRVTGVCRGKQKEARGRTMITLTSKGTVLILHMQVNLFNLFEPMVGIEVILQ